MGQRGQSIAAYLEGDNEFPAAVPRPSFGRCKVVACDRLAEGARPRLCESHRMNWSRAGRPHGAAMVSWCARQRPIDPSSRVVVLRGLAERVQLEVLYGLQCRARAEQRTSITSLRCTVNFLRRVAAESIFGLSIDHLDQNARLFLAFARDWVSIALAGPDTEMAKDDWDLRVFGRGGGRLHFGRISQPWLNEAAKRWASERLEAAGSSSLTIEQVLRSLGRLSESLRRHRDDQGVDAGQLSRADLTRFASDLGHLETSGVMSRYMRRMSLRHVELFLREARGMALTMAGRPLVGLSEDVALRRTDMIGDLPADDAGRALPAVVMDQLLDAAALELLEATADADVRAMVELQARVGRRTAELCGLRWNCLRFDEVLDASGSMGPAPVMVHDMPKVAIRSYHLPIDREAAEIILAQQARVRDRYSETPVARLALFPALARNPRGVKARSTVTFRERFRVWVDSLPDLVGVGGEHHDRSRSRPTRSVTAMRNATPTAGHPSRSSPPSWATAN
jgi:integrase